MKLIKYYNQDLEKYEYLDKSDLIEKAWTSLPFEFVLEQMDENPDIKDELMRQLFLRARRSEYVEIVKKSNYYSEYVSNALRNNDKEILIHLVSFYEPDLLNNLFKDVNNLVDCIMEEKKNNNLCSYDMSDLTHLSTFECSDDEYNKIIDGIKYFSDLEYENILRLSHRIQNSNGPFNMNDKQLKEVSDYTKNRYINIVINNKEKHKEKIKKPNN